MAMQGRKLSAASMEMSSARSAGASMRVRRRLQAALEEAVEHLAAYA